MNERQSLVLYYDKECWICKYYSKYLQLKKIADLELRNARDFTDELTMLQEQGYDINTGMILIRGEKVYHGHKALKKINRMIDKQRGPEKRVGRLIARPIVGRLCYKLMTWFRKLFLMLQSKTPIL